MLDAESSAPRMKVLIQRGANDNPDLVFAEIEVAEKYQPDILADMCRHVVTSMGAMFPEDDDADLIEQLETEYDRGSGNGVG
jgi:hypothetical protein